MNRKNTILIAVLINAGLLAVLLVAALTMQDEPVRETVIAKEDPRMDIQLPKFDHPSNFAEVPSLALLQESKTVEEPVLVHKLPPMTAEPTPASTAPTQIVAASAPIALQPIAMNEIVVKKGDSLERIAKNHRTTVDEIIKLNHLPSTFLKIGQVLKMPGEKPIAAKVVEKKVAEPAAEYYTMKVGENPWAIAQRHKMKVEDLLKLNALNEEKARKLKPGDRLRIR